MLYHLNNLKRHLSLEFGPRENLSNDVQAKMCNDLEKYSKK